MTLRKWPWGRIVTGTVAAVILLLAIPLFFTAADIRRRADEARTVELLRLKVDLSKPGVYAGRFTHDFAAAHGNCIQILTEPPPSSYEEATRLIKGMTGHLSVTRVGDTASYDLQFGPECFEWMRIDDARYSPVIRFHCGREADYELKLVIENGAPRLTGIPQTLSFRYEVCGMEYIPASIATFLGIVGCTIAGILVLIIVIVSAKKRRGATS